MKLHHHTAFSFVISGISYMIFKSWGLAIASFLSGVFIDLDHVADFIREYGWSLNVKKFFRVFHNGCFKKVILLFHGWEWLLLWTALAWLTSWNPWITGILIGLTQHLILDTYYNAPTPLTYSILWRMRREFDLVSTFQGKPFKHLRTA